MSSSLSNSEALALANRRLDTKVQSFDMITAITQRGINSQLEALQQNDLQEDVPRFQEWNIASPDGLTLLTETQLGPPQVQLLTGADNNNRVTFFINIKAGNFVWRNNGQQMTTEFNNWRVAFDVTMSLQPVSTKDVPEKINNILLLSGMASGDYTLQRLFLDFTNANMSTYNDRMTLLPGQEPSTDPKSPLRIAFRSFIQTYLQTVKPTEGKRITIAFIPKADNPPAFSTPSIPPTALRFQSYPYAAKKGAPSGDSVDPEVGGNNMLLYLQMTNKRALPASPLGISDNWVVPGPDRKFVNGCVALSKKIFLDEWLIPKLVGLNRITDITATYAKYHSNFLKEEYEYGWQRATQDNLDYNFKFKGIVNNELVYTFEHPSELKSGKDNYVLVKASVVNTVTVPLTLLTDFNNKPNCVIKVSGMSRADLDVDLQIHSVKAWGQANWNCAFKFDSGIDKDGGLKVVMDPPVPVQPVVTNGRKYGKLGTFGVKGPDPKDLIMLNMQSFNVGPILNELNVLFSGAWQFYFAGAGTFFFKDAIFNQEGDLLLDLQYKGISGDESA